MTGTQSATSIASGAVTASKIASGTVVKSLNGLHDDLTIAAGTGASVSASGSTVTVSASPFAASGGRNPMQVALQRWYEAGPVAAVAISGTYPTGLCFDGYAMWATMNDGTVRQYRASDASLLQTVSIGFSSSACVYDGAYIWVPGNNGVTKIQASSGAIAATYSVSNAGSLSILFDGTYIWTANSSGNSVTKLRASDGAVQGTFSVSSPTYLAFDGTYIWVATGQVSSAGAKVVKLSSDGSTVAAYNIGVGNGGTNLGQIVFDGSHMWVGSFGQTGVFELGSDGSALEVDPDISVCIPLAFDGVNIWVADQGGHKIAKIRASDATIIGTYSDPNSNSFALGIAFDGASIWAAREISGTSGSLSKY